MARCGRRDPPSHKRRWRLILQLTMGSDQTLALFPVPQFLPYIRENEEDLDIQTFIP